MSIDATQVISSARQLQNIASLDATTTATIEAAIQNAPNTFTDLLVTGISTLGVTSATDLTAQQLNVSGVSTFQSGNLKIRNPANTFEYSIISSAITANRTLTIPVINGNDTISVLNQNQTYFSVKTFSLELAATGIISLSGGAAAAHVFGTNQTTGTLTFGGTSGTGLITFGRATTSQQTDIQAGVTASGNTKTINLGTGGASGSNTQINIGPTTGVGTVVINSGTNLGIGSTTPTSKLTVRGDSLVTGVVTAVGGFNIGIQSVGLNVVSGVVTAFNFIGYGNTFNYNPATKTIDISIAAGAGGTAFSRTVTQFIATEGQTTFNVNYTSNYVDVYLNGVRLTSSEYTATSGTSIVLTDSANSGDIVDIVAYINTGLFESSKWNIVNPGSNIYRLGGNVGIGTDGPTSKLHVVGDSKIVGVVTANYFIGDGSLLTGIVAQGTGIQVRNDGVNVGTAATLNFVNNFNVAYSSGIAEISAFYVDDAGISTSVIGGIGSVTQLQVSGISTFTDGPVIIGTATSTGTESQPLQVTGGAYVSGNIGIGTTNPSSTLTVQGDARVSGVVTATTYDTTYVRIGSVVSTSSTTAQVGIHSALSSTTYRSVEYMVQAAQGTNFHTTKILAVHDGTTAYLSEYGTIYNNSTLANYDVDISGGNIRLLSTPASSGITTYVISFTTTKV